MPRPDRYLPVDPDAKRVRVELPPETSRRLVEIGAPADLTVSGVCRVALTLLAAGKPVNPKSILAEANRIRTTNEAKK